MSKRLRQSFTLVAVALALVGPARAEDAAPKPEKADQIKTRQFTGTITALDAAAGTHTVKKSGKKEETKTFHCAADCTMATADKKRATLADFKVGDKVMVRYTEDGDKLLCHHLAIKVPKPKKEKAKAETP